MAHQVTNINVRGRLTQVLIMMVLILAVLVASQVAEARGFGHKIKYNKSKYRIAVHKNSHKTCYILFKKRTSMAKRSAIASGRRSRSKGTPQAETDKI